MTRARCRSAAARSGGPWAANLVIAALGALFAAAALVAAPGDVTVIRVLGWYTAPDWATRTPSWSVLARRVVLRPRPGSRAGRRRAGAAGPGRPGRRGLGGSRRAGRDRVSRDQVRRAWSVQDDEIVVHCSRTGHDPDDLAAWLHHELGLGSEPDAQPAR